MRPIKLPPINPVSMSQVLVWRRLQAELEEFEAELEHLPGATPPSAFLVALIRAHRAKLCRLMSRDKGGRLLAVFPDPPHTTPQLAALLGESALALDQFQKIHSSEFSEREDGFVLHEDF